MRARTVGAMVAALILITSACASSTTATPAAAPTSSSTFSSSGTATGSPGSGDAVEIEREDSSYGEILTDGDGATLYVFTQDVADQSSCTGDCATTWPPVLAADGFVADPEVEPLLQVITRDDGGQQLTIAGRPLYTFSGDEAPGDTNGQALSDAWFVVSATGEPQTQGSPRGY